MSVSITTILTVYKRPEYLQEQIHAILNQTIPTDDLWIWVNGDPENQGVSLSINKDDLKYKDRNLPDIQVIRSSKNFKYHGRFALGLLSQRDYISILDDDTIPGENWYKNCMDTYADLAHDIDIEPILGGAGVILQSKKLYYKHRRAGWPVPSKKHQVVDLVGHAWFMPREALNPLWTSIPPTFQNGEDIQLAAENQLQHERECICPAHDPGDTSTWSSLKPIEYGNDSKASSNGSLKPIPEFYEERDALIQHYFKKGWRQAFYTGEE